MRVLLPDPEYWIDLNEVGRLGCADWETIIRSDSTTTYGDDVWWSFSEPQIGQLVKCRDEDGASWLAEVVRPFRDFRGADVDRAFVVKLIENSYCYVSSS